jgi:carboxylesterase type B
MMASNRASRPICPQLQKKCFEEELFGSGREDVPQQILEQSEFECLNLNITCPAGLTSQCRVPVMLWVHGCVYMISLSVTTIG